MKQKSDFFTSIHGVRLQAFQGRTIRSSFTKCGIYPINADFALQKLGWNDDPDLPEPVLEIWDGDTPPPASSSIPNSPVKDVKDFRKYAKKIKRKIDEIGDEIDSISPKLRRQMAPFLAGGLALVEAGAQYAQDNINILDLKRRKDANKTKRRVNMGGPLSSLNTKRHIKVRDDAERKRLIQQAKKKWIAASTLEAALSMEKSKPGDINTGGENAEADDSVNIKFTIDTIGEGC